jgi:hypothetical protein
MLASKLTRRPFVRAARATASTTPGPCGPIIAVMPERCTIRPFVMAPRSRSFAVDAVAAEHGDHLMAELVVAEASRPTRPVAEPLDRNRHVDLGAGDVLLEHVDVSKGSRRGGREHHERLAQGRDIDIGTPSEGPVDRLRKRVAHPASPTAPATATAAALSRRTSSKAPAASSWGATIQDPPQATTAGSSR